MNKKLVEAIRQKFEAALSGKTGWGRVELLTVYDRCVTEALAEALDAAAEVK